MHIALARLSARTATQKRDKHHSYAEPLLCIYEHHSHMIFSSSLANSFCENNLLVIVSNIYNGNPHLPVLCAGETHNEKLQISELDHR